MHTATSKDGTPIAYEVTGSGPAVVLVGTAVSDHHDLDGLAGLLAADCTVVNYDRRGRGESGDVQPYSPAREVEDLEAVLDAVGAPATLASGSGGCVLALDAARALGDRISALYLYEPPFIVGPGRPPVPADFVERVTRLVAEDRRSEAVEVFMVEAVGVPAEYIEPMKADPSWTTMAAYAHTLPYDGRIVEGTQNARRCRPTGGRWTSRPTSSSGRTPSRSSTPVQRRSSSFCHAGRTASCRVRTTARSGWRRTSWHRRSASSSAPRPCRDDRPGIGVIQPRGPAPAGRWRRRAPGP